jgi:hypothetical protein
VTDKNKIIVWIVAVLLIAWGGWIIHLPWLSFECLFNCSNVDSSYIWFVVYNFAYAVVLPVGAFVSAYGLFMFRSWGRVSALTICWFVLISALYSAVRFAVESYQYQGVPPRPLPEEAVLIYVSMWNAYIPGLVGGISVFLLLQNSVKRSFSK